MKWLVVLIIIIFMRFFNSFKRRFDCKLLFRRTFPLLDSLWKHVNNIYKWMEAQYVLPGEIISSILLPMFFQNFFNTNFLMFDNWQPCKNGPDTILLPNMIRSSTGNTFVYFEIISSEAELRLKVISLYRDMNYNNVKANVTKESV